MGKVRSFWIRFRSAITGRWVTRKYAEEHPDTTVQHKTPKDQ